MAAAVQAWRACLFLLLGRQSAATDFILTAHEGDSVPSDCQPLQDEHYCKAAAGPLGKEYAGQAEQRPRGCYLGEDGRLAWRSAPAEGPTPPAQEFEQGDEVCVKYQGMVEFGNIENGGAVWKVGLTTGDDKFSSKYFDKFDFVQKTNAQYKGGREVCGVKSKYFHGQRIYADGNLPGGVRNGDAGAVDGLMTAADGRIMVKWDGADSANLMSERDLRTARECDDARVCRAAERPAAREQEWLAGCLDVSPRAAAANCYFGRQPLGVAAYAGAIENVKALLDHNASVDHVTDHGLSALTAAVWQGHKQVAEALAEAGANVGVTGEAGTALLMTAASHSYPELLQLLVEKRADPTEEDDKGWTALNYAVKADCLRCIDYLAPVQKNLSNIDHADAQGNTALHLAAQLGHLPAAALLAKHGADAHLQNNWGQSAIDVATQSSHSELAEKLRTGELPASSATSASRAAASGSAAERTLLWLRGSVGGPAAGPAGCAAGPTTFAAVGGLGLACTLALAVVGCRRRSGGSEGEPCDSEECMGASSTGVWQRMSSSASSPRVVVALHAPLVEASGLG